MKSRPDSSIELDDLNNVKIWGILQENLISLNNIQDKLASSKALNGGFDKVVIQLEKIEGQVDQIHSAVYDPDDGLYARIKIVESNNKIEHSQISSDVCELRTWKKTVNTSVDDHKLSLLEKQIEDLQRWKNVVTITSKWVIMGLIGGVSTIGIQLIYSWIAKMMNFVN